ncbi:MAG: Holliday junction branch migration DNA helicase RuvB, partial [Candidatus Dadabacteria bacterium]|nr:Holliday junction branch migration DNA helicase RuvB [Candidatus Dadabacteria bacterium]
MSQDTERTVSPEYTETDELTDMNLRPAFLRDFIGQPSVKEQVDIFIGAAKARG